MTALIGSGLEHSKGCLAPSPSSNTIVRGLVCPTLHVTACDQRTGDTLRLEYLPDSLAEVAAQLLEPAATREAVFAAALEAVEATRAHEDLEYPLPAQLVNWRIPDGPMHRLLRWTHPRVLLPALELLRERLDTTRLGPLEVEQDSWVVLVDFDAAFSPPRPSVRHYFWHLASVLRPADGAASEGAPDAPVAVGTVRFLTELSLVFSAGSVEDISASAVKIIDYDFDGALDRELRARSLPRPRPCPRPRPRP